MNGCGEAQVVVAVLLDNFYRARRRDREAEAREEAAKTRALEKAEHPMDPLLLRIANTFDTVEDLERMLDRVFFDFDVDGTGKVSFSEFSTGLFKFQRVSSLGLECVPHQS